MRILISGFEVFGNNKTNPTSKLIIALENKELSYPSSLKVDQILLPVTFEHSFELLQEKIESMNPDIILCFGLAAKKKSIELENVAVNKIDAEIEDNQGEMPKAQLINIKGPDSYFSTLPLLGMEAALKSAGIPVKISNSAGSFVCNYLFYRLMESNQKTLRLCGFIHVPQLPEDSAVGESSQDFNELKRAVEIILNYINY